MRIKMRLSTASISEAVKKLREEKEEIKLKTSLFVQRLAEVGLQTVNTTPLGEGDSNPYINSYVWMSYDGKKTTATLVIAGEDVAFIEFGAGVYYNGSTGSSPDPRGQELNPPMVIGSYGMGQGQYESWRYYDKTLGRYRSSHGTKAAMPMYKAEQEIMRKFRAVAQEVFGDATTG